MVPWKVDYFISQDESIFEGLGGMESQWYHCKGC